MASVLIFDSDDERDLAAVATCSHSSLVGQMMSTCVRDSDEIGTLLILSSRGSTYAAVFPLPVSACPTTSLPARISGMHSSCMLVGTDMPSRHRFCESNELKPSRSNWSRCSSLSTLESSFFDASLRAWETTDRCERRIARLREDRPN
eukprot:9437883-Pyramimonas_sp.AAC.2